MPLASRSASRKATLRHGGARSISSPFHATTVPPTASRATVDTICSSISITSR